MLSEKQKWRRQVKQIYRSDSDSVYKESNAYDLGFGTPNRSMSEPTLVQMFYVGKMFSTTGDLISDTNPAKKKGPVNFSNSVKVVLIPQRTEYAAAGIDELIWWGEKDYSRFKSAALSELRELMSLDKRIDSLTARRILYQPQEHKSTSLDIGIENTIIPTNITGGIGVLNTDKIDSINKDIKQASAAKYSEYTPTINPNKPMDKHNLHGVHPLAYICS